MAPTKLLELEKIGKRFGARWAVRELSVSLAHGEILGLVGANGGGKTTSLRMMAGLISPDCGQIRLGGQGLHSSFRRKIGYLTQQESLYSNLTLRENLLARSWLYGLPRASAVVATALKRFGLEDYRNQRFSRLSGGWKRRAQFAAVSLHHPQLMLLDEPTAGLDAEARQAIWQSILELAQEGCATVISTHDLEEVGICQQLAVFRAGQPPRLGKPADWLSGGELSVLRVTSPPDQLNRFLSGLRPRPVSHPWGGHLRLLVHPSQVAGLLEQAAGVSLELDQQTPTLTDWLVWLAWPEIGQHG